MTVYGEHLEGKKWVRRKTWKATATSPTNANYTKYTVKYMLTPGPCSPA